MGIQQQQGVYVQPKNYNWSIITLAEIVVVCQYIGRYLFILYLPNLHFILIRKLFMIPIWIIQIYAKR
ncbi:hypothetical protein DYY65_09505 [Nitrososphaera sp. AFS]|nr:hypothetical protein [Nitrososphaera sp. AFS]